MGHPAGHDFDNFVDERISSTHIEGEEHSITAGSTTYSIKEIPDTELAYSCTGSVHGCYNIVFTDVITPSPPASGTVNVSLTSCNVAHNAADADDTLTWDYWGTGTANNAEMCNQYQVPIDYNRQAAGEFRVEVTGAAEVEVKSGNVQIAGAVVQIESGTIDLTRSFDHPGYFVAIRVGVELSTATLKVLATGQEKSTKSAAVLVANQPPGVPETKTAGLVVLHDGAALDMGPAGDGYRSSDVIEVHGEVPSYTGDGGGGGGGGTLKKQYEAGVVSGDAVCVTASGTVNKADANNASAVPAQFMVEAILDDTYCSVKGPGQTIDFTGKNTTPGAMTPGAKYYLSTAAGYITPTEPTAVGEYYQIVGTAISTTVLLIQMQDGHWIEEGIDPKPVGRYRYQGGVSHGEFVHLMDGYGENTVDEAKANHYSTMPAIGCVIEDPSGTHVRVGLAGYLWLNSEHGDARPSGVTNESIGTVFYVSPTIEGQAIAPAVIKPSFCVQSACVQLNAAGTMYRIICGAENWSEDKDPERGYDYPCGSEVTPPNAGYLDSNGVVQQCDATDDAKCNPLGLVRSVNEANTWCNVVLPGAIYKPWQTYGVGEWFLNPSGQLGHWIHGDSIGFWPVNAWKVRVGYGRGDNAGIRVDIHNYGKMGDPTMDGDDNGNGDNDDIVKDRIYGYFKALGPGVVNRWAEAIAQSPGSNIAGAGESTWTNPNVLLGILVSREEDVIQGYWIWKILMHGKHGSGYEAGVPYFAQNSGTVGKGLAFGKYKKPAGVGQEDGQILVNPGPVVFLNGDVGDPTPVEDFVTLLDPLPVGNPYDKIRDHDGTTAPIIADRTSSEWLVELSTVVVSVDFFAKSTGAGAGAFLELDLLRGSDSASLLTTKAKLVTTGVGTRGDTLPASANSAGHTRAVIDITKMPVDPGDEIYWTFTRNGVFTTAPYGIGVMVNKYGVKG